MPLSRTTGAITSVQRCPGHRKPMELLAVATFVANHGIAGDRHASPSLRRQVLLVEGETLEEFSLAPGAIKENITTSAIDLMRLQAGTCLRLGADVRLELTSECEPCSRLDEILPGLQELLAHRRGVLARVLTGGEIRPGDAIVVETDRP